MSFFLKPLLIFGILFWAAAIPAADWPQFRGPGGLGVAPDKNLPTTWSAKENVVWKTEMPGAGSSSPIIVGKKIFVTSYSGYGDGRGEGDINNLKRQLLCLDLGSQILWKKEVPADLPEDPYRSYLANHGYASSTPVSDGSSVFAFFGKSGVWAFDLEGKDLWHKSVGTEKHPWGSGSSPILYKDLIILNAAVESGAMVALHKKDGSPAWTAPGMDYSWTTPILVNLPAGKQELVVSNANQMLGFDPANGTLLWQCKGIQDYVCPSVIAHDDVVYVIGARENTAIAIRAGGKGDVTKTHILWEIRKGSNVCSPVYHEGHLYWGNDKQGVIYCVRADNGQLVFEERLQERDAQFYASPVAADGKLYFVSREHGAYVLDAQPKYRLLAHNTLGDATYFNGSPAISGGRIILRSDRFLYCLGLK